jgi:co-chaperonin GroES (HSP10)
VSDRGRTFRPTLGKIIARVAKRPLQEGSIVLPEIAGDQWKLRLDDIGPVGMEDRASGQAVVVSAHPFKRNRRGVLQEANVRSGQKIIYIKDRGERFVFRNVEFVMLKEEDILAVMEDDHEAVQESQIGA